MSVNLKKKTVVRDEPWQIKKDAEHFFCSSSMYWNVGTDLLELLTRQAKLDKNGGAKLCAVYKVPLPVSEDYDNNYYAPQVEGAELITMIEYGFKK